jgi:ankyrin repeat protein
MIPKKEEPIIVELNLPLLNRVKILLFFLVIILPGIASNAQMSVWDQLLLTAASEDDMSSLTLALDSGAVINSVTEDGVSALMYASESGNLNMTNLLIDHGADPNLIPWNGKTALIGSVRSNNFEISELLIRAGAEINHKDNYYKCSALHYAIASQYFEMVDMLLYYDANPALRENKGLDAINLASWLGYAELVEYFIEKGIDPNSADTLGNSPLINSIHNGHIELAKTLMENGGDLNQTNKKGYNALHIATIGNSTEIVEFLIVKGVDLDQAVYDKLSPVNLSRIYQTKPVRKMLFQGGARRFSGLYVDRFELSFDNSINWDDYFIGGGFGLHEVYTNTTVSLSFMTRLYREPIYFKNHESIYYQYWEKRYFFALKISKNIPLIKRKHQTTGFHLGISELASFGSWSGSNQQPKFEIITSPHAGFYWQGKVLSGKLGVEYYNFEHNQPSPYHISASLVFNIPRNISIFKETQPGWTDQYTSEE